MPQSGRHQVTVLLDDQDEQRFPAKSGLRPRMFLAPPFGPELSECGLAKNKCRLVGSQVAFQHRS